MAHILTLNQVGRHPRPAVGPFLWNNDRGRYVWKNETLHTAPELAAAVNEALPFLRQYDNPFLEMTVLEVDVVDLPTPVVAPPESTEPVEAGESLSKRTKRLTVLPKT